MKICDFVECELQKFRDECNFTCEELEYFEMKAKDKSNIEIALRMNVSNSKVSAIARKVRNKIVRIIQK